MSHARSPFFRMYLMASVPCVETRVEQRSVQRRLGEAEEDMTSSPIESCLCIGSMHLSGTHDAHYN
jgi:hypothetical protein